MPNSFVGLLTGRSAAMSMWKNRGNVDEEYLAGREGESPYLLSQ